MSKKTTRLQKSNKSHMIKRIGCYINGLTC